MKSGEEDTKAVELVLIRRRGGGEEGGHHGGVWKIAYADFMTAMMAFFLVMWLINSTDQKVLTQVANYFNPMRLTDNTPHERGVKDIESGDQGKAGKESMPVAAKEKNKAKQKPKETKETTAPAGESTQEGKETTGPPGKARYTEQALFSDPYGVLARIAADAETPETAQKTAAAVPHQYRDPFDLAGQRNTGNKQAPGAKTAPPADKKAAEPTSGPQDVVPPPEAEPGAGAAKDQGADQPAAQGPQIAKAPAKLERSTPAVKAAGAEEQKEREQAAVREALKAIDQAAAAKAAQEKASAEAEATRIFTDVRQVLSQLRGTFPNIDVTVTEEGILISLTDDADFGMFAIASAEPRPAMVVIMERIAKIVQTHRYPLVVRGHTDGRPYRSGSYDNWRLSTARAHMAYYMLVRGGVEERRFERVEGHADRNLRIPGDPEAAQNRRIEILLRRPKQ